MAAHDWPDPNASYEVDASGAAAAQRWQQAIDDALARGDLYWSGPVAPDVYELHGKCPRCGHSIDLTIYFQALLNITGHSRYCARTNIECNCDDSHPGRSDPDAAGCGWALLLEVDFATPIVRDGAGP